LEPFEAAVEAAEANIKKLKVSLEVAKKEEERLKAETDTLLAQIPTPQIPDIGLLEEQLQVALDQVSTLKAQNDRAQVALREAQDAKKIAEEDAMAAYADDIAAAKSVVQDIKLSVLPAVATQEDLDKLAQLELLYAEAGERKQSLVKLDKDKEMEQLREKAQLKRDLDAARSQSARTAEYKDTISKLQGQLAVLAKHECYTCHQPWTNSSLQKDKAALEQKIEETRAMLTEAKRADKRAKELVQQLHDRDWTFLPDPTIAELAKVEAALLNQVVEAKGAVESANARATAQRAQKLQEAQEVLSALEHESRESCRTVTESKAHEVDIAREAAHSFSTQLAAASAARDLAAKELSLANQTKKYELAREEEAQNRYHTARRALERAVAHLEDVGTSLAAEKDFVALVGRKGFLGAIFDEVLDEIAAEANRILGSVPNTSHVTIAFPSESQTKAGTTKIEIIPALTIGGKTATLKSLSGGMDSVVALAVDLALTRVVSQRTGHAPGWLILDESFEGLGATEKEGCLNILQDYAQERLVLIVDHSSVLQEHFDVILGVESTQDRSSIVAT
jgi:DNA repair exonuclease SbcCD ATPase subunit